MSRGQSEARVRNYRALIVEDDPAIRKLVEKLLSRKQMDVEVAPDGRTAIQKLRDEKFSVVVLDLMVPEVNGFEVIEFLKRENIQIPVAVVSAVSQQALTQLDLDIVKLVISKPFDVDEFTKAVLTLCEDAENHEQQQTETT
ncbi:MAG TPA: response regulator [Thermoanaerobaculia bacterium]|jgi:DNA-binding response OmpR family regulator